ncbi:MAG: trigger factor [Waddliaceae bacterium]
MTTHTEKNENITVAIEKKPGCQVNLDIQVSPKATKAAHERAIKNINKEVNVPGFRKGRAPTSFILENYAKYIKKEWEEVLINVAFKEALTLLEIVPYSQRHINKPKVNSIDLEKGSEFSISFETAPEIPSVDIEKLKIDPVEAETVDEEKIELTLKNIRLHYAEWDEIEDRAVEENDYVNISIESLDDQAMIAENNRFQVSDKGMAKWMRTLIVGKKKGDAVEGTSEKETDEDVAFKQTKVKITIHSIHQPKLPEFDEELFKKIGVETLDELKEKVQKQLENRALEEKKAKLRDQLEKQLIETHVCEIPHSIFQSEKEHRLSEFKQNLTSSKLSEEEHNKALKKFEDSLDKRVQEALSLYFVTQKAGQENQIQVSNEEITSEMMRMMFDGSLSQEQMQNQEAIQSQIYMKLARTKIEDFLLDKIGRI